MYGLAAHVGADLRRRSDLSLPAAAGASLPRRLAADRARRRLLAQRPEGEGPSRSSRRCCAMSTAPRRPTIAPWSCASRRSAAATCRCSWPALPIFSRAYYGKRPFEESTPRRAARQRPLQGRPLRGRALYRIRPGQGLVGRQSAGAARPATISMCIRYEYYRDRDVAFEGFTGKSYTVPRGIHLAHLGDALRFSGDARRPREARRPDGRDAVRRAGLVPQHAPREVPEPATARGADLRLRFRMDQPDHHVRLLRPHPFGVPEFRHDGERQAGRRRTDAARAVPRQGAGRGVRRAVRAAGDRRLRARTAICCARRRSS